MIHQKDKASLIIKLCLIFLGGTLLSSGLLFLFTRGTLISTYGSEGIVIQSTASAILFALILSNCIAFAMVAFLTFWTIRGVSGETIEDRYWYLDED